MVPPLLLRIREDRWSTDGAPSCRESPPRPAPSSPFCCGWRFLGKAAGRRKQALLVVQRNSEQGGGEAAAWLPFDCFRRRSHLMLALGAAAPLTGLCTSYLTSIENYPDGVRNRTTSMLSVVSGETPMCTIVATFNRERTTNLWIEFLLHML